MFSEISVVSKSKMLVMPWKNGGGTTTEIWISPSGSNVCADFEWRLSSAKVTCSGDFSLFPNYERHLIQLEGEPFLLQHSHPSEAAILKELKKQVVLNEPYRFDGAWETRCTMAGSGALDFNLMVRKDFGRGFLQSVQYIDSTKAKPFELPLGSKMFFVWVCQGAFEVLLDGRLWLLESGDLIAAERHLDTNFFIPVMGKGKLITGGVLPRVF